MRHLSLSMVIAIAVPNGLSAQVRIETTCRPSGSYYICEQRQHGRLAAEGECRQVGRDLECDWRRKSGAAPGGLQYNLETSPGVGAYMQGQRNAAEMQRRQVENQLLEEELLRRRLERQALEGKLGQGTPPMESSIVLSDQPPSTTDKRWCLTDGVRYSCTYVLRTECRSVATANGLKCEFNPARN